VPYHAILGKAEVAAGEVALRLRDGRQLPPMTVAAALARISCHVRARQPALWDAS
jgi:threonyl-tRNA synthetase